MDGFRNDIANSTNEDEGSCDDDNDEDNTGELTFLFFSYTCFLELDACFSNPCQNNGVCSGNLSSYSCRCPNGFKGQNCEGWFFSCHFNYFVLGCPLRSVKTRAELF